MPTTAARLKTYTALAAYANCQPELIKAWVRRGHIKSSMKPGRGVRSGCFAPKEAAVFLAAHSLTGLGLSIEVAAPLAVQMIEEDTDLFIQRGSAILMVKLKSVQEDVRQLFVED